VARRVPSGDQTGWTFIVSCVLVVSMTWRSVPSGLSTLTPGPGTRTLGLDVVQAFDTGEDGPVGVAVGREVVVEATGRVDVVVTGAVDVVVAPAVVVVVDGTGRVVAVVTVGGSLPRLRTDRAVSSGDRGHTTAAPTPRADSTNREISRRRRSVDFGGDGSNMAHHLAAGPTHTC
jgi:hypothetical protein